MRHVTTVETGLEAMLDSATLVAAGDRIFTTAVAPDRPGGLESQIRQVFQRLAGLLHDAGSSLDDIVRTRSFFVPAGGEIAIRSVHSGVFGTLGPAVSAIRMTCLPRAVEVAIEVEAVRGAAKTAVRHGPNPAWGASLAVKTGREVRVSGVTADWPGVAPSALAHEQQVAAVCTAVTDTFEALGTKLPDVVATRHFDPMSVHRHSFQGPALEDFRKPGEPTSAGITVEGVGGDCTFMLEAEAVEGAAAERRNLRTGRTFEVEHHYSRSVRVGDVVYVAGSTSLVPGEIVRHPGEVRGQVLDTLETIRSTIEAQGLLWGDLVRTRSYVVGGPERLAEAAEALKSVIGGGGSVATLTGVPVLGRPEVVVEIEATAVRG